MRTLIFICVAASMITSACSSKDDAPPPQPTTASENDTQPPPASSSTPAPAPTPITITIQGIGRVSTTDLKVDCTSDGATTSGTCTAVAPVTLYEGHTFDSGWRFDHWEPSGSTKGALFVPLSSGVTTVTGVFVPNK